MPESASFWPHLPVAFPGSQLPHLVTTRDHPQIQATSFPSKSDIKDNHDSTFEPVDFLLPYITPPSHLLSLSTALCLRLTNPPFPSRHQSSLFPHYLNLWPYNNQPHSIEVSHLIVSSLVFASSATTLVSHTHYITLASYHPSIYLSLHYPPVALIVRVLSSISH